MNALTGQVIETIRRHGYRVEWDDAPPHDGTTNLVRRTVTLSTLMDGPRALHVVTHELAHIVADEIGADTHDETLVTGMTIRFLASVALRLADSVTVGPVLWNEESA